VHRHLIKPWLVGVLTAFILFSFCSLLNLKQSPSTAPACDNQQYVNYIGCPQNNSGRYYVSGFPHKMYCYNDGKDSCSPWSDFLSVERNSERSAMLTRNETILFLVSLSVGLMVTSSLLTYNLKRISSDEKNLRD
jgi:hypothetical protein